MTTAIILINVNRVMLKKVTEEVKKISGVTEVYTVAGEYDLVAMLKLKDMSCLSRILTESMSHIDGISRTKTLLTLEVTSDKRTCQCI